MENLHLSSEDLTLLRTLEKLQEDLEQELRSNDGDEELAEDTSDELRLVLFEIASIREVPHARHRRLTAWRRLSLFIRRLLEI